MARPPWEGTLTTYIAVVPPSHLKGPLLPGPLPVGTAAPASTRRSETPSSPSHSESVLILAVRSGLIELRLGLGFIKLEELRATAGATRSHSAPTERGVVASPLVGSISIRTGRCWF